MNSFGVWLLLLLQLLLLLTHCGFWAFLQKLENSTLTFVHFFSCLCNVEFLVFWAVAIVGLWRRRRNKKKKSKKRRRWICADLLMTSCRESCVMTGSFMKLHIKICIYIFCMLNLQAFCVWRPMEFLRTRLGFFLHLSLAWLAYFCFWFLWAPVCCDELLLLSWALEAEPTAEAQDTQ